MKPKKEKGVPRMKNPPPPPREKQWIFIEKLLKEAEEYEKKGLFSDSYLLLMSAKYQIKLKLKHYGKKKNKKRKGKSRRDKA